MDQFYMIVLGAISVLLIIMLTAVGLLMYSAKSKPEAPLRNPCPDYWTFDGAGCKIPAAGGVNIGRVPSVPTQDVNAGTPNNNNLYYSTGTPASNYYLNPAATKWGTLYTGKTEVCAKNKWATDNGVVWDGYTNTTEC